MSLNESTDRELCPVCHEEIQIYALGQCNHPICFRCSIRMRFLCDQMYCPICRTDIKQVAFIANCEKFENIRMSSLCMDRRAMIFSENLQIQQRYRDLLKHRCTFCSPELEFNTFLQLKSHISKEHKLMCCKLCTDNLKLFSHERKFYQTHELVRHKKVGDPDDKSYKGHPLCKFCDERYFDNDALVIHLRKDHFYCHFCETDGKTGEFFCNYEDLRQHFKEEHYLCEEGDCATVQWTNAFRSDIDLRAHVAQEHIRGLDKHQTKRLKTLDLEFAQSGYKNQRNERMNRDQRNREEFQAAQALTATLASVQRQGHIHIARQGLVDMLRGVNTTQPTQETPFPTRYDFPDLNGAIARPKPEVPKVEKQEVKQEQKQPDAQNPGDRFAIRVGKNSNFWNSRGDFPSLPLQKTSNKPDHSRLRTFPSQGKNAWVKAEVGESSKVEAKKNSADPKKSDRFSNQNFQILSKKTLAVPKVEDKSEVLPATTVQPENLQKDQQQQSKPKDEQQQQSIGWQAAKSDNSKKNQPSDSTSAVANADDFPPMTSLKQLTKMYKNWALDPADPKSGSKKVKKDKQPPKADPSKRDNLKVGSAKDVQDLKESSKQSDSSNKQPKKDMTSSTNDKSLLPQISETSIKAELPLPVLNGKSEPVEHLPPSDASNSHVGPPPGFSQTKPSGPPPGFSAKTNAPPGFAPLTQKSESSLIGKQNFDKNFPSLSCDGSKVSSRILKVATPAPKLMPSGVWPLAPEIPALDSETADQRLSRLILIEKDQSVLESMKILLLKLNQGMTEPEDFYGSCNKLLNSSVLALTFKDIAACIKSPKDRAKVLFTHQKQIESG